MQYLVIGHGPAGSRAVRDAEPCDPAIVAGLHAQGIITWNLLVYDYAVIVDEQPDDATIRVMLAVGPDGTFGSQIG